MRQTTGYLKLPVKFVDQLWQHYIQTKCNVWLSSDSDMSADPVTCDPEEISLDFGSQKYLEGEYTTMPQATSHGAVMEVRRSSHHQGVCKIWQGFMEYFCKD